MTVRRRPLRLTSALVVAALAVLSLSAGCSSGGSSSSSSTARETAEKRLEAIGLQLAIVLSDYQHGKKQQAYTLAVTTSAHLYEGTTEHYVARVDLTDDRVLDPLLAATIPAAITNGQSASQVAALIRQAQTLAAKCLTTIHQTEASGH